MLVFDLATIRSNGDHSTLKYSSQRPFQIDESIWRDNQPDTETIKPAQLGTFSNRLHSQTFREVLSKTSFSNLEASNKVLSYWSFSSGLVREHVPHAPNQKSSAPKLLPMSWAVFRIVVVNLFPIFDVQKVLVSSHQNVLVHSGTSPSTASSTLYWSNRV